MTTTAAIVARATALGVRTSTWKSVATGRLRIYAETNRRDLNAFLELDGVPEDVEGAAFKVFCDTPQHSNWVKSQVNTARKEHIGLWHAFVLEHYAGQDLADYGPDIADAIQAARAFESDRERRLEQEERDLDFDEVA